MISTILSKQACDILPLFQNLSCNNLGPEGARYLKHALRSNCFLLKLNVSSKYQKYASLTKTIGRKSVYIFLSIRLISQFKYLKDLSNC